MARIVYLLKAFGRTSETFITNEILLLEQLGLSLQIYSLKCLAGQKRHLALDAIEAPVTFLPEMDELSHYSFVRWLWRTVPKFLSAHGRLARRCGWRYGQVAFQAVRMCFRYRESIWSRPRKVFIKEFFQAGFVANSLLDTDDINLIHAHFCHGATTVAMFVSSLTGIALSFTAHAKDIYVGDLNPRDLLPLKMQKASLVVTCTNANKSYLDQCRLPGSAAVHAIYHGLDTQLFAPSTKSGNSIRILSVGRFVEKKGFAYLVEACAILRHRSYDFECVIIGGADTYQQDVERRITEHQLSDYVRLRNSVTQEELCVIYSESTIFALPCQVLDNGDRDGIPNVLAEAMAMELAVVSTDISGIPEIVQSGVNGLRVPSQDPKALADAIARLIDDPELRRDLGKAARRTILDIFDSRKNTRRLAALLMKSHSAEESVAEEVLC